MTAVCRVGLIMRYTTVVSACAAAAIGVLSLVPAPAAAQIPNGLDPAVVQQMLPAEITVPAGQTTTVDVGVPVSASYEADGWAVSSSGTAITVTAPDTPGATAPVTASAAGYSATVTLVAVGDVPSPAPAAPEPAKTAESAEGPEESAGTAVEGAATQPRSAASPVDTSQAKRFSFDAEIHGNQIVVKVPLSRAGDLLPYANTDQSNAKVRYLDIDGQVIEGVSRDIDVAGRTLTLTYPEGETPDNPFIIEVVRDDARAEFIAVLTATNAPVAQAMAGESGPYSAAASEGQGNSPDSFTGWPVVLISAGCVTAIIGMLLIRRGRKKRRLEFPAETRRRRTQ